MSEMEEVENQIEAPAIKALGSLFKLTEVYLRDDGSKETREISFFSDSTKSSGQNYKNHSTTFPAISDFSTPEDIELAKEMEALGLPLSFVTAEQSWAKMSSSRKKGTRSKHSKASEMEIGSPSSFHDNPSTSLCRMSMPDQNESSCHDVAMAVSEDICPDHKEDDSASLAGTLSGSIMEYSSAQQTDIMSKNDDKNTVSSTSLGARVLQECCLMEPDIDRCNNEHDGSLMEHECSSRTHCNEEVEKVSTYDSTQQLLVSQSFSTNSEVLDCDYNDQTYGDDFGDWRVYWDSFYSRNYFYNTKTEASTWDPPEGMENLVFVNLNDESNEMATDSIHKSVHDDGLEKLVSDELPNETGLAAASSLRIPSVSKSFELAGEHCDTISSCDGELTLDVVPDAQDNFYSVTKTPTGTTSDIDEIVLETVALENDNADTLHVAGSRRGKNKTRRRSQRKLIRDDEELQFQEMSMSEEYSASIGKYWCQRYQLFSKFDDGIKMDEEGWFSVTPELIARHHASRCGSGIVVDSFTGVGGNAIQLAQRSAHVIAIDVDPRKIDYAYHNAVVYGVSDQIDFVTGDFFMLAPELKADTVFLSPPWGGPDYAKVEIYDLKAMLRPHDGYFLFNVAKKVACQIVMFLPRNVDLNQLAEMSLSAEPPWSLEVEKNFLNGKLKGITAYFTETTVGGN